MLFVVEVIVFLCCFEGWVKVACGLLYSIFEFFGGYCILCKFVLVFFTIRVVCYFFVEKMMDCWVMWQFFIIFVVNFVLYFFICFYYIIFIDIQ